MLLSSMHTRIEYTCVRCGAKATTVSRHAKYCPDCRIVVMRQQQRMSAARLAEMKRATAKRVTTMRSKSAVL